MKRSPKSVEKEMIVKKDVFAQNEQLTAKQIKSYFSSYKIKKLKVGLNDKKKRTEERDENPVDTDLNDTDLYDVEDKVNLNDLENDINIRLADF